MGGMRGPECRCGGQRTTFRSQFFPFTVKVSGVTLRSSGLTASFDENLLKGKAPVLFLALIHSGFLPFLNPHVLPWLDLLSLLYSFQ